MGSNRKRRGQKKPMIFSAWNYKVLVLGLLLIIVGFIAMYMENEVRGVISLYISPLTLMAGYVTVIVAILKHDQSASSAAEQS